MNSESNELIAGLFSDSMNIEILCSIYENEVTADSKEGINYDGRNGLERDVVWLDILARVVSGYHMGSDNNSE
ncbi:MAG: hypothetical protein ACYC6P_09855 [Ignavibacteriaceae bacterium]